MACTTDFIEHVCRQIAAAGEVRSRKMFGDYMVYLNGKPVILMTDELIDAILRLKYETPCGMSVMGVEYYRAMIEGGARTWDEFASWRKRNPADDIVEWTP